MNIQPIHNDADLDRAFARLEELWAVEDGTPEADELEVLSILIESTKMSTTLSTLQIPLKPLNSAWNSRD